MYPLIQTILTEVKKNLTEPLTIKQTSAYKRGYKKHKNDKRVMGPLKELLKHLIYNKDVPNEFNDHMLSNGELKGLRTAHIKGQQVVILYQLTDDSLKLLGLGSHHEIGTM